MTNDPPTTPPDRIRQTNPRHLRRLFGVAIEVMPPVLQAAAAVAATITFTFIGRHFVNPWLAYVLIGLAVVVLLGSSVWSYLARRELLKESVLPGVVASRQLGRPSGPVWVGIAAAATFALIALCILVTVQGLRPAPSFASPYDGADPNDYGCADSAVPVSPESRPDLKDLAGVKVGHLELERSEKCATVWVRVFIDPAVRNRLKGETAHILTMRTSDGVEEPYPLRLKGGDVGYGNMLSDAGACVQAKVFLQSADQKSAGPTAETPCI